MTASARITELRKRLEKDPGSRLFAQLAEELRKEGQLVEAVRVSRDGLAKHPTYPSARMTLARCLFDSGDLEGARAELEQVVAAAPDNILAQRLLGESREGLGELTAAAEAYRAALRFSPGDKGLSTRLEETERRAAELSARARPAAAIADMENRFAASEGGADEPPPLKLVEAEEEFEIERSGEALEATLPPAPRPDRSPAPPVSRRGTPAPPPAGPAEELVFDFEADAPAPAAAATFEPVFRPLDEAGAAGSPEAALVEELDGRLPAPAPEVPAYPAAFQSSLPATVPGVPLAEVAGGSLASPTLAELYFKQGAHDRAIETYEEVLRREPGNDAARRRLAQIGALVAEQVLAAETPEPADRRAVLMRTIARLEGLLAAVGRR